MEKTSNESQYQIDSAIIFSESSLFHENKSGHYWISVNYIHVFQVFHVKLDVTVF